MSERVYLQSLCSALRHEHELWATSSEPTLSEGFIEIAAEAIEGFGATELPPGTEPLADAVTRFASLWRAYRGQVVDDEFAMPSPDLFAVLDEIYQLEAEAKVGSPKAVESIAELTKQGVFDAQICRIYEWIDSNGNLETSKLQEERAKPGTHVTPDFVHPAEMRRRRSLEAHRTKLKDLRRRSVSKITNAKDSTPETLDELVAQGLSARQIARMTHQSASQVILACQDAGIDPPPIDYASPQTVRAPHEPPAKEAALRSFDAGRAAIMGRDDVDEDPAQPTQPPDAKVLPTVQADLTLEQQVITLSREGYTSSDIAEAVTAGGVEVNYQKVNGILRRAKENPELFA